MTRKTFNAYPKTVNFDITLLLSNTDNGGLYCLSQSTWELAYRLIQHYGEWRSRYFYRDVITGELLTITDEEYTQVTDVYDLAMEELRPMICDDLLGAINSGLAGIQNAILSTACCGTIGVAPGIGNVEEGGTPPGPIGPITFDEPEGTIVNRKCKVANLIHDTLADLIQTLDGHGVDTMAIYGVAVSLAIVAAILAVPTMVGAILSAIAGASIALTVHLLYENVDLGALSTALSTHKQDLVCALYNAGSTADAQADYAQVLTDNGVSTANVALVKLILFDSTLAALFFSTSALTEDEINSHPGTINCIDCGGCQLVQPTPADTGGGGTIEQIGPTSYRMYSVFNGVGDNTHRVGARFNFDYGTSNWCGTVITLNVTSVTGLTDPPGLTNAYRCWNQSFLLVYSNNTTPPTSQPNVAELVFMSGTAFSVEFDIS